MRSVDWTIDRLIFAVRHPRLTVRFIRAINAPWPT